MNFLFCENPLNRHSVDDEYDKEYQIAKELGHQLFLCNFEKLVQIKDASAAIKNIYPALQHQTIIYRGWMLKPNEYQILYEALASKNYRLINTPQEYRNCHYLPDSLKYIEHLTPKTVWVKWNDTNTDFSPIFELLKPFGNIAIILKDFVKSQKHNWDTACFILDASDGKKVVSVVRNFLDWQGDDLNEGLDFSSVCSACRFDISFQKRNAAQAGISLILLRTLSDFLLRLLGRR